MKWRLSTGVTKTTINRDFQFLRNVFNFLIKKKKFFNNPIDTFELFKEDNIRTRVLDREEIHKLLRACEHIEHLHLIVNIAINNGLRKGEIMSLVLPRKPNGAFLHKAEREGINWLNIKDWKFYLNHTKTKKPRTIPIADSVRELLSKYIAGKSPGPLWPIKNPRRSFKTACKKAGLDDIVFHDLRRTFISILAERGFTREMIQSIAGQVSERVYRRYFHPSDKARLAMLNEIGNLTATPEKIAVLPQK